MYPNEGMHVLQCEAQTCHLVGHMCHRMRCVYVMVSTHVIVYARVSLCEICTCYSGAYSGKGMDGSTGVMVWACMCYICVYVL